MHRSIVSIPITGQVVEHHCTHDSGGETWRVEDNKFGHGSTTYLDGTVTELVEFGEASIKAAIGYASISDLDPAYLWRDYLRVVLDRAERACVELDRARMQDPLPLVAI